MIEYMLHNLTVEIENQQHWNAIAEDEDDRDKQPCVE